MNSRLLLLIILVAAGLTGCNTPAILGKAQRHTIKSHKPTEPSYFEILYLSDPHANLVCIMRLKFAAKEEFNKKLHDLELYIDKLAPKSNETSTPTVLAIDQLNPPIEIPLSSYPYWTKYEEAGSPSFEEIDTFWQQNVRPLQK